MRWNPEIRPAKASPSLTKYTANLVLQDTIERIFIKDLYADIPRGIFLVRGENVLLLGEIVRIPITIHHLHSPLSTSLSHPAFSFHFAFPPSSPLPLSPSTHPFSKPYPLPGENITLTHLPSLSTGPRQRRLHPPTFPQSLSGRSPSALGQRSTGQKTRGSDSSEEIGGVGFRGRACGGRDFLVQWWEVRLGLGGSLAVRGVGCGVWSVEWRRLIAKVGLGEWV